MHILPKVLTKTLQSNDFWGRLKSQSFIAALPLPKRLRAAMLNARSCFINSERESMAGPEGYFDIFIAFLVNRYPTLRLCGFQTPF